jgi:hypothetical protein
MLFFDSGKPIATCVSDSCDHCPVSETLHCHFSLRDLAHFLSIAFPPFLLGGAGIYHMNGWMLVLWVFLVVGFFGFVEIRVMCSHCPHYAETGQSLKCWANYGSPKLWKYRPGPMNLMEKAAFFGGFVIVFAYPLIFLARGHQWFLLVVYAITLIGFFTTLRTFLCSQCMNFACPLNTVQDRIRRLYFERNPEVAKAWGIDVNSNS